MEIYKVPEYLILHLKRFKIIQHKSKNDVIKRQKDEQLVNFPITSLNMSYYVR